VITTNDDDVVIISAVRTPFGKYGGALKDIDYYDLGAIPMKEVLERVNLSPNVVDEVFWGVGSTSVCKDPYTPMAARQSLIKTGLPHETRAISFDMACVSAMHAVKLAAMSMRLGEMDTAIAGGATSFSQEPLIVRGLRFHGYRLGHVRMEDPLFAIGYKDFSPMAVVCDNVAAEYGIGRQEQDEWALRSHINYGNAWNAGKFKDEIMPLTISQEKGESKELDIDEQYRPDCTLEKLSRLKTIYGTRAITAGNSPGMNDGAAAILVMTRKKARELKLEPLATVVAQVSIAINVSRTAEGPGYAIQKVLKMADLSIDEMAVMEINEGFACVPLVSTKLIAGDDAKKLKQIRDKMNVNGSCIATGHPNTASGARVLMNTMYELRRRGGGYALGAVGGGLGLDVATIIKVE
jgi:acetyl-CoA C-acetyltransferase